jgi:hypothetical protein
VVAGLGYERAGELVTLKEMLGPDRALVLGRADEERVIRLAEQSQRGGLKKVDASTTGIIPGDRGKAGGSWCRPPLHIALAVWQAYVTSSSGRSRVRSVHTRTRN